MNQFVSGSHENAVEKRRRARRMVEKFLKNEHPLLSTEKRVSAEIMRLSLKTGISADEMKKVIIPAVIDRRLAELYL